MILTKMVFPGGGEKDVLIDEDCKIEKNFKLKELANNKASDKVKMVLTYQSLVFLSSVQEFRNKLGKPMNVSSCYRTASFNKSVGGDAASAHLHACALDYTETISGAEHLRRAGIWKEICSSKGIIGAINLYTHGQHLEMYSDKWYGATGFKIRDYRGKKGDW